MTVMQVHKQSGDIYPKDKVEELRHSGAAIALAAASPVLQEGVNVLFAFSSGERVIEAQKPIEDHLQTIIVWQG